MDKGSLTSRRELNFPEIIPALVSRALSIEKKKGEISFISSLHLSLTHTDVLKNQNVNLRNL